jgi:hypothetical protein
MELGSYFLFLQEQIKDIIIERRAGAARTSLLTKNYLYIIEHAQVDVADDAAQDVSVRVYGYHMEAMQVADEPSNVLRWTEPLAVCVQCTFASNPAVFTQAACAACAADERESRVEFVEQHVRACLRRDPAARGSDSAPYFACAESLALVADAALRGGGLRHAGRAPAGDAHARGHAAGVGRRREHAQRAAEQRRTACTWTCRSRRTRA